MDETDISTAAVERLLDGVTAGPWTRHGTTSDTAKFVGKMHRLQADGAWMAFIATWETSVGEAAEAESNTDFIAASRDLVPALLADRDRLQRENDNLRQIERNVQAVREHEHQRANAAEADRDRLAAEVARLMDALGKIAADDQRRNYGDLNTRFVDGPFAKFVRATLREGEA